MSLGRITCAYCGTSVMRPVGQINRAKGGPMFCSQRCVGRSRKIGRSVDERRQLKAAYDAKYRADKAEVLRAKKSAYFQRTYDPEKQREKNRKRMPEHVAYCRRYYADPKKKAAKVEYDTQRRAMAYADFAEAWRLLVKLEREIRVRCPDKYERAKARGYFTRINERKHHDRQDRNVA